MSKILYCDGWSNHKDSGYILCDENSSIHGQCKFDRHRTNNEAEYEAMVNALSYIEYGGTIYTDSRLIWGQLTQNWKIKAEHLRMIIAECRVQRIFKQATIIWIPREQNLAGILIEKQQKG